MEEERFSECILAFLISTQFRVSAYERHWDPTEGHVAIEYRVASDGVYWFAEDGLFGGLVKSVCQPEGNSVIIDKAILDGE